MSNKLIYLGVEPIELAGQLAPLTISCVAATHDKVEVELAQLIDWTDSFWVSGDRRRRRPPNGGGLLSSAEWERALSDANLRVPLTWQDVRQLGHPPRRELRFLWTLLSSLDVGHAALIIHRYYPELNAVANAIVRWVRQPLPDFTTISTGFLELARRHGLRPKPQEPSIDFTRRIHALSETPPSLDECVDRLGLDPGVPQDHPLYRAHATRVLYQDLRQYFGTLLR